LRYGSLDIPLGHFILDVGDVHPAEFSECEADLTSPLRRPVAGVDVQLAENILNFNMDRYV